MRHLYQLVELRTEDHSTTKQVMPEAVTQSHPPVQQLSKRLSDLWTAHSTQSDATKTKLRSVGSMPDANAGNSSNISRESLKDAHKLWSQVEGLIAEVADIDVDNEDGLLRECQRLLTACDVLVAGQEELVRLCDLALNWETTI